MSLKKHRVVTFCIISFILLFFLVGLPKLDTSLEFPKNVSLNSIKYTGEILKIDLKSVNFNNWKVYNSHFQDIDLGYELSKLFKKYNAGIFKKTTQFIIFKTSNTLTPKLKRRLNFDYFKITSNGDFFLLKKNKLNSLGETPQYSYGNEYFVNPNLINSFNPKNFVSIQKIGSTLNISKVTKEVIILPFDGKKHLKNAYFIELNNTGSGVASTIENRESITNFNNLTPAQTIDGKSLHNNDIAISPSPSSSDGSNNIAGKIVSPSPSGAEISTKTVEKNPSSSPSPSPSPSSCDTTLKCGKEEIVDVTPSFKMNYEFPDKYCDKDNNYFMAQHTSGQEPGAANIIPEQILRLHRSCTTLLLNNLQPVEKAKLGFCDTDACIKLRGDLKLPIDNSELPRCINTSQPYINVFFISKKTNDQARYALKYKEDENEKGCYKFSCTIEPKVKVGVYWHCGSCMK